jgi:hypothetical protein
MKILSESINFFLKNMRSVGGNISNAPFELVQVSATVQEI